MRFPQFIEPWNNYIVSELLTTFPTNSLSWDQLAYDQDSSLKNLHYGLIHNGFQTTCIAGEDRLFPYINQSFIPLKHTLIQNGDLILADASEDRKDVGRPVEMLDIGDQKIVSGLHTIHAKNKTNLIVNGFKGFYFQSSAMKQQIFKIANGSKIYGISSSAFNELKMFIPEKQEQKKIVDLMIKIEKKIQTQSKIIDTLSSQKKQIRNLLFKDIHKNANCCIQDYVIYEQPQKYIVHSTDYLSYGKDYTPVLTANQSFILGYTLEKDGIYEKGDCIIFDDFTNENKYVDFPFKVKSSALKILQTKEGLMLKFFYEYLQFLNFESTDHKRHYLSEVAVTDISVPNLKEQTFVCKIFTSFDNKLRNEKALLEKYRLQKQFLLNNLFI